MKTARGLALTTGGLPLKRRRLMGPHNAPPRVYACNWQTRLSGPMCSQLDIGRGDGHVAMPRAPPMEPLDIRIPPLGGGGPAKKPAGVDALSGNALSVVLASLDSLKLGDARV